MAEGDTQLTLGTVLLIVAIGWGAMCLLLSLFGWARLAEVYAREPQRGFEGTRFRLQSCGFRGGPGYNGGVSFGVDDEGLTLSASPLLRLGHPPLFFPWADIEATERRAWLVRRVDLRFARAPGTELRITPRLAARLAAAAGGSFPAVAQEA